MVDCTVNNNKAHSSAGAGGGIRITGGEVVSCVVSNNESFISGSGVYISGGIVRDSEIVDNIQPASSATTGGGVRMTGGLIERCLIQGNTSSPRGGGVHISDGILRNSLILDNTARNQGGGIYMASGSGQVLHCTISGNRSENEGQGIYMASGSGSVSNSVAYYNGVGYESLAGNIHHGGGTVAYSCMLPVVSGTGNIADDPFFRHAEGGDYRLFPGSPCIDSGAVIGGITNDLERVARPLDGNGDSVATPDMGAYESGDPSLLDFSCRFSAATNQAFLALDAVLAASVAGANTNITWYGWDFDGNGSLDAQGAGLSVVTNSYGTGFHTVSLTVSNSAEQSATFTRTNYIKVAPGTNYVWQGGTPTPPYDTWAKAAADIQSAVDAAWASADAHPLVLVTNGTYSLSSQITVVTNITVRSVGGPEVTILDAGNAVGRRVFRLAAAGAVLDGFTLKRGIIRNFSDGAGGIMLDNGTVTNCHILSCESWSNGGGVWMKAGLLTGSRIYNNSGTAANANGVGGIYMQGGIVRDCIITNNWTTGNGPGAGVRVTAGWIEQSLIGWNSAGSASSTASDGGGLRMSGGTATHVRVIGNTSYGFGGGVYMDGGLLRNSLVGSNSAPTAAKGGGGVYLNAASARMESCTVVGNTSVGDGKGLFLAAGSVTNSVIYANSATPNVHQTGGRIVYSCMNPLISDEGNTAGDPQFVDATGGDYRLGLGSAAVDQGTNQAWMATALDLDGTNRILNALVDMGAYEKADAAGGPLACSFAADQTEGYLSLEVAFTATVSGGNTNIVDYQWDFGDGQTASDFDLSSVSHTFPPGYYTITLTVINDEVEQATATRQAYIRVVPETVYAGKGGTDTPPYLDWANAASNVQAAIDLGSPYVRVGPGTYTVGTQVNVVREVDLRGVDGPTLTIIDAANSGRTMLVNATNALVSGITLRGGKLFNFSEGGPGLRLQAGTVSNVIVTANSGYIAGAGAHVSGGLLTDSEVRQNSAVATASNGGGLNLTGGTVERCLIAANYSNRYGGGARIAGGLLTHSQVVSNYCRSAADASGGGLYIEGGIVRNSLVARNGGADTVHAGGIWMSNGMVESSTVVSNSASTTGGGIVRSGGTVTNTIVVMNSAPSGNDISGGAAGFGYSLSPDLTGGVDGNLSQTAVFVDADAGNYRLQRGSDGENAGLTQSWMSQGVDLDRVKRIVGGAVDMGAYEIAGIPGTIFLMR